MKEELIGIQKEEENDDNEASKQIFEVKYKVTDAGLLSTEIVPFSHLGTVQFSSSSSPLSSVSSTNNKLTSATGVTMIWDVTFLVTASSRRSFWQIFTNQMISDAINNFSSFVAIPKLYTRRTKLIQVFNSNDNDNHRHDENNNDLNNKKQNQLELSPKDVMDKWIQFCWKGGAGMPFPPPIHYNENNINGDNVVQVPVRWIIPPFLKERITSSTCYYDKKDEKEKEYCELCYTVDNPSIFTYQVHSHQGRIQFIPYKRSNTTNVDTKTDTAIEENGIEMIWEVEIRPYYNWSTFVQIFTAVIISAYARNFKCHVMMEGDEQAMINLRPHHGDFAGLTLANIRRDSWIGGVLDAHYNDKRSVLEQSWSFLQPWTWGRSSAYDEEGEGESWNEDFLI